MSDQLHETSDDVLVAATMTIGVWSCPDVHILLIDDRGRIFARAVMAPGDFASAAASVADQIATIRAAQGDIIGDVVGRA